MRAAVRLLNKLESLTHDARVRRMVELGQEAGTNPQTAELLAVLEKGGFFERLLALQSCYGSKDGGHALRALKDPSRTIQVHALKLIALFANDAQVHNALQDSRADLRLPLLYLLRRRHRLAPIDAFLDNLAACDPAALGPLLPFGSLHVVNRHFEIARPRGGQIFWRRLARFHPDETVQRLTRQMGASPDPDARLIWEANTALMILAKQFPDQGVEAARLLLRHGVTPRASLELLARYRPLEIADLILGSDVSSTVDLSAVAHRLDNRRLLALLDRGRVSLAALGVWWWFRKLPWHRREEIYRHCDRLLRDKDGCVEEQLLRCLPRLQRVAEGRRHLKLPALEALPQLRLKYAAFLPWEEARRVAEPFLNHPEADLRSAALQALIDVVRFDRDRRGDLLALLRGRRHEQDPVRCTMLSGLAQLPPSLWKADDLHELGQILRDALSAADLSSATASHAQALVVALLPFHPDWSSEWMVTLVRERGQLHLGSLEQRLTDAEVRRIAPALAPVLKAWQTREREVHLVVLGQCLGRRLRAFDALMAIFRRMLRQTRTQWVAGAILQFIAQHKRAELKTLVPELLRKDPSWITQAPVLQHLHRRRQDLLTPFLGQRAYKGRFSTGKVRYVLPLSNGFFRWTPAQQTEFARTLTEITHAKDKMRDVPTILWAISVMAGLPAVEPKRLVELAEDERLAVQEAALRALGKLDAGQGIAALLEALGDNRCRIAIYALRKALLRMPAKRALPLLKAAPLEKVTVAKEYVRLLGDMPSAEAFRELCRLNEQELHRDVRVALLRALWGHLEHEDAWTILNRAVESPDPALMTAVIRIPADRLSDQSQRRLTALLARMIGHTEASVRTQTLQRCIDLPVPNHEQVLLPRFLSSLQASSPDERQAAASALFAICRSDDASRIAAGLRDALANRRALMAAVQALAAAACLHRTRLLPIVRGVLDVLAGDRLTAILRVSLAIPVLPSTELADLLERLALTGELHADALAAAVSSLQSWIERTDRLELQHLESRLASASDDRLRRLALAALIAQAELPGGWSDARLERLRGYRRDPSPLVAAAAQFTFSDEAAL
ncbi:MAG TPA: hypothetical protein VMF69_07200 [Gemmataceae bacterium]|nr:hypothetical protein [Gemmataceae bacterium]